MRKTKSQLRAEQIAKLQAEQHAYDKRVKDSVKTAAFARCAAVEEMYEMLSVKPEPTATREGKNGPVQVSSDKDETKRSNRLVEAVTQLIAWHDEYNAATSGQPAAPAVSGQTTDEFQML